MSGGDIDDYEKKLVIEGLRPYFRDVDHYVFALAALRAYRERGEEDSIEDLKRRVREILSQYSSPKCD